MATALILGANGFVGPWLARELKEHGYHVCASDVQAEPCKRLECDSYQTANLLEPASLDDLLGAVLPDQVYNLAAVSSVGQSWRKPALAMRVNVEGVVNLLEACRTIDPVPRILLVGSSEEYAPSEKPLTEESPIAANNPYGISKEAQGRIATMYFREYGMPIYRVRAFNHTGPGQAPTFVVPSWCRQVAEIKGSGKPGIIRVGNLDVARDFSDVRDIVRGYRMLVESEHVNKPINLGSGRALQLRDLLRAVIKLSGAEVSVEVNTSLLRAYDTPSIRADISLAKKCFGWQPEIELEQTVGEIIESYL